METERFCYIITALMLPTEVQEEKLLEGTSGIYDLTKTKGYVREDEDLDDYKQLFDTTETEEISSIGSILYWESDGFVWQ